MNKKTLYDKVKALEPRSAWNKGVKEYALELVETLEEVPCNCLLLRKALLNGADTWRDYSYGGCSLIYDSDIAERLCTPSELKRKKGGELPPNSRETWLDTQSRALNQACRKIINLAF